MHGSASWKGSAPAKASPLRRAGRFGSNQKDKPSRRRVLRWARSVPSAFEATKELSPFVELEGKLGAPIDA
jgi:hypothetical protein